jgi:hypothetical protein
MLTRVRLNDLDPKDGESFVLDIRWSLCYCARARPKGSATGTVLGWFDRTPLFNGEREGETDQR